MDSNCPRTRWNLRTIKVLAAPADDIRVMPNLYFCQPHAQNQGMLRAVISIEDCRHLVTPNSAIYLGDQFPKVYDNPSKCADFAVVRISAEEADSEWRPGYYRFEADLMELNAQLLTLTR